MNIAAIKLFLLSRFFLGSTGTIVLLLLAITFNWLDAYKITRNAFVSGIEYMDTMREWGQKAESTAEKVGDAYDKAQKELESK